MTTFDHPGVLLANRYQLQQQIGAGAMGMIFRAYDRLTSDTVALKRVIVGSSTYNTEELRFALLREFRTLASLRHPHIISVLDYGFDSLRQPFYTMPMIDQALDVVSFARDADFDVKLRVISQLLQALAYLHRRGVLHRDLKPMNVLVDEEGTLRVVDFGLAVITESSSKSLDDLTAGTLAYMAPELYKGERLSPQADLYAVGVIAYEIFAGRHPFNVRMVGALINDVMHKTPDLSLLPDAIRPLMYTLLAKTRGERMALGSALMVREAFYHAFGLPVPRETLAVRESYLQAAAFVGREEEMRQLTVALNDAMEGKGSAWLIGGESGVGKSRVVNELRTLALVNGALVAETQSITETSSPFRLWASILRRLCLSVEPSFFTDFAVAVMRAVVPDIDKLIGGGMGELPPIVPTAPTSEDDNELPSRLLSVMTELFRRQRTNGAPQPVVVIFEDLHWASRDSVTLLSAICRVVDDLPVMIVATYRDDETPELAARMTTMRHMRLPRLSKHGIAELSESILGAAGRAPKMVDMLERETEGNAFFLVEVIRALAEEAGDISNVGISDLPERVFTGGVQKMVERRLSLIPAQMGDLLQLAAVIGRQIDLPLLRAIEPNADVDAWVAVCSEANVIDIYEGEWRFAHDKLREGVLGSIAADRRAELHGRAAAALERLREVDVDERAALDNAALLAYHYQIAGDKEKERHYLAMACDEAGRRGAYRQARMFGERAMELANAAGSVSVLWLENLNAALGRVYAGIGEYAIARGYFDRQLTHARERDNLEGIASALGSIASIAWHMGGYQESWQYANDSAALFRALNNSAGVAWAVDTLSSVARWMGDYDLSRRYAEEALALHMQNGNPYGVSEAHHSLGVVAQMMGDNDRASAHFHESLRLMREIGTTPRSLHQLLNSLATVERTKGNYAEARRYYEESLTIARENDNQRMEANIQANLGKIALFEHQYAEARRRVEASLAIAQAIHYKRTVVFGNELSGTLALELGMIDDAERHYQEALTIALEIGERHVIAMLIKCLGDAAAARGDLSAAWGKYRDALGMLNEIKVKPLVYMVLIAMARTLVLSGDAQKIALADGIERLILSLPNLNAEIQSAAAQLREDMDMRGGVSAAVELESGDAGVNGLIADILAGRVGG